VYTEGVEGIGAGREEQGRGKVEGADDSCHLFLSYLLIDEYEFEFDLQNSLGECSGASFGW
jgi:hypothetical protein